MDATTTSLETLNSQLNNLGYQYKYDSKNRLVEKRIPAKGLESIVYNKLDQPVLTQDANLKKENKWLFTKYDIFGRVAYTGMGEMGYTRVQLQDLANGNMYSQYETIQPVSSILGETTTYYSSTAIPTEVTKIYTINYYDTYIDLPSGFTPPTNVYGQVVTTKTKSLLTVSKVKVLDIDEFTTIDDWITTVTYYDNKARPIYRYSKNEYLNTIDIVEMELDFTGKALKTRTRHQKGTDTEIVIVNIFTYDHIGRLIDQYQYIGDDTLPNNGSGTSDLPDHFFINDETVTDVRIASNSITVTNATLSNGAHLYISSSTGELIAKNHYDELGQLDQKKVGNTSATPLQTVDYAYNIRGWLKRINQDTSSDNDLFNFELKYNNPTSGTALFNGNISQTSWNTLNEDTSIKTYTYSYDALNRIIGGIDNTGHYNLGGYNISGNLTAPITYDKNGNITALLRKGHLNDAVNPIFGVMDNLVYAYDSGNKLMKVTDTGDTPFSVDGQFKDKNKNPAYYTNTDDYSYDANGNMTKDYNKGITYIIYNHLNLPASISLRGALDDGNIDYVYDATGIKLRKIVHNGNNTALSKTIDYAGNYVYESNILKFFNHPEGYVEPKNVNDLSQGFNYIYQYKDHLGNIRLSYKDTNGSLEILEENNYYPFGLKHKGYNGNILSEHPYKFGGKELSEELGLNTYDFGARNYSPDLGRWMNLDPLAEKYIDNSPYVFTANNPIYYVEIDGRCYTKNGEGEYVPCEEGENGATRDGAFGFNWTYGDSGWQLTDVNNKKMMQFILQSIQMGLQNIMKTDTNNT